MIPAGVKIPVPFNFAFPQGAVLKSVAPAKDWDDKFGDGQAREGGQPLWLVTVDDQDPQAAKFGRDRVRVKVVGEDAPQPPAPLELPGGLSITPVELTELLVTPWVDRSRCDAPGRKCRAGLSWSMRASGLAAPNFS